MNSGLFRMILCCPLSPQRISEQFSCFVFLTRLYIPQRSIIPGNYLSSLSALGPAPTGTQTGGSADGRSTVKLWNWLGCSFLPCPMGPSVGLSRPGQTVAHMKPPEG